MHPRTALLLLLALATPGCGIVNLQTPGGAPRLATTAADAAPAPDHPENPARLEARHCELLAKETSAAGARLAAFQPTGKAFDDLKTLAGIRREADERTRAVQEAFDAAYRENSRKNVKHMDYPNEYRTTNNTSAFGTSLVAAKATAKYVEIAGKLGVPPSASSTDYLTVNDRVIDASACVTPELLAAQKAARPGPPVKVVDLDSLRQDFATDLPIKPGDMIAFGGDVASAGKTLVLRREHGNPIFTNCRDTNQVDRIENGRVEYVRTCDRAGGVGLVLAVKVTPADAAVPYALGTVKAKDRVWLRGRVVRYAKSSKKEPGNVQTTTHDIEIEPVVVTNVDRAGKSLFAF